MKKVLIVTNNQNTRQKLENIVREQNPGNTIYITNDLEKAYEIISVTTIHLFLIDIMLQPRQRGGDVSGAFFIQNVRRIARYQFTPVIVFSTLVDQALNMYARLHCYAYVEKPFDAAYVKKLVAEALCFYPGVIENRQIFFRKEGTLEAVFINDIIMAEGKDRDIILETTKGRQKILYRSCRTLFEELDSPQFLFCSRSIIVNRNYVEKIDAVNGYLYLRGIKHAVLMGKQKKYDFLREIKRGLL
ncbi:putative uncharacterized protein [Roseburia sp. CAG:309]|nr:putative uncharacterized protein [Roseburia sp. CAG:309]